MNDAATHQLETWEEDNKIQNETARKPDGAPYKNLNAILTACADGPPLLQDTEYLDLMQNFVRKNIPGRIVHAKGTGAHGYFELTNPDMSKYSKACIFQKVGQRVDLFGRFGTPDQDQRADIVRSVWTWSIKLYTEDGNMDITTLNFPAFHVRDAKDFFNSIGSRHANPQAPNGYSDQNMFWDFATNAPESCHFFLFLHSDRGQPVTFRHLNAFPINIFRLVNAAGEYFYARFTFKTDQGVRFLTDQEADILRKKDTDYAVRDLYNAIARKDFPSYTWTVQIMDKDEPAKYFKRTGWNPFDNTKIWPQGQYPLIEIGKIVFNRNMDNFFNESILSAFNPGSLIPGIEAATEDRVFLGRVFEYEDAQLHRVGSNKFMIPINQPKGLKEPLRTYAGRCPMNFMTGPQLKNMPNYYPNSMGGPVEAPMARKLESQILEGNLSIYELAKDDNFTQPRNFYEGVMQPDEKQRTAENLARAILNAEERIQLNVIKLFSNVSQDLSMRIEAALKIMK